MPDLYMDVDIALAEVPVNLLALIDDTTFKDREEAVGYAADGLELIWHFTTTAGATTAVVVTPTTGGVYDWAHQDGGLYTIEMPASDNDTEGFGWFTGVATGVLPWRGPVIGFRAAGLNNLLIDTAFSATRGLVGTALPAVAAEGAGGIYTRGTGAGQVNQDANGRLDSNVAAVGALTAAATRLSLSANQIIPGNVQWSANDATTTTLESDDITEAIADHFNGRIILFTNGALAGQATNITDYELNGSFGKFTFSAVTGAPADESDFIII